MVIITHMLLNASKDTGRLYTHNHTNIRKAPKYTLDVREGKAIPEIWKISI